LSKDGKNEEVEEQPLDPPNGLAMAEAPIDAGEVTRLAEDSDDYPVFKEAEHRAKTARSIALLLIWILAGTFTFHYLSICLCLVLCPDKNIEKLLQVFDSWLPVMSGFVGAAVTYYYTRER